MAGRLDGKVALITGGTSGIGEATVEVFAREGAKVVFTGRGEEAGNAIADRVGGDVRYFRADVTREEDIRDSVAFTVSEFGAVDILFNNAGGPTRGGIEDVTAEQFREAMDLLLGSVIFGTKYAVPHMKERGWGRIINNSSIAALRTDYGGYLYSAAKAAVTQVTRVAALQLAPHGITVNTISPGGIATPVFYGGAAAARNLEPEHNAAKLRKLKENLAKSTPRLETGLPEDIAYGALYLASDEARFVNAHDLVIDAGMSAGGRTDYGPG